jgi:cation transporter-like permease
MVRMIPRIYKKNKWKIVFLWVIGSICLLIGSMIAGQLQRTLGTDDIGFLIALLLSLMFFLVAGLFWIAVVLAFKEVREE